MFIYQRVFPSFIVSSTTLQNRFINSNRCVHNDLVLYGDLASPAVRFVLITAALLKTRLQFEIVDLFRQEHKTEYYKKINPHQKVPALVIGGKSITDSHAITMYLCNTANDKTLYPQDDPLTKAKVDEMLFYNASTLFPANADLYADYFVGKWPPEESKMVVWNNQLNFLEERLSKFKWLSGDKMLLGDVCCALTVSSQTLLIPVPKKYKNIRTWMEKLNALPSFEINRKGLSRLKYYVENNTAKVYKTKL